MDVRIIISFLGGLITVLALVAGMVKPWRGLFLLWALGVSYGVLGLIPRLQAPYFALVIASAAALLLLVEKAGQSWRHKHREAVVTGEQLLLGSLTAFILAGIFLGPLWGMALGGGIGGLGAAYLHRQDSLTLMVWGLLAFVVRGVALLLTAVLLNGHILPHF